MYPPLSPLLSPATRFTEPAEADECPAVSFTDPAAFEEPEWSMKSPLLVEPDPDFKIKAPEETPGEDKTSVFPLVPIDDEPDNKDISPPLVPSPAISFMPPETKAESPEETATLPDLPPREVPEENIDEPLNAPLPVLNNRAPVSTEARLLMSISPLEEDSLVPEVIATLPPVAEALFPELIDTKAPIPEEAPGATKIEPPCEEASPVVTKALPVDPADDCPVSIFTVPLKPVPTEVAVRTDMLPLFIEPSPERSVIFPADTAP
jgi:hypothetical protein